MDWNEVKSADSLEELKKAKLWLFKESIRIQNEKADLEELREKFIQEKSLYQRDMDTLNQKFLVEQKRLKEEKIFFEKKKKILQEGFDKLDEDRKRLAEERRRLGEERKRLENQQKHQNTYNAPYGYINMDEFVGLLFRNVSGSISLRKRYKDLMKIFHPDNNGGDAELVQLINKEFSKRKEDML